MRFELTFWEMVPSQADQQKNKNSSLLFFIIEATPAPLS